MITKALVFLLILFTVAPFIFILVLKILEKSPEPEESDPKPDIAPTLRERALVFSNEKNFDVLATNLRTALGKKLIPKVGDPPGEFEVKRYLADGLDLFAKVEVDDYGTCDLCLGFNRSSFPEFCVKINRIGEISVEQLHYSMEFQEKMDRLHAFLIEVVQRDELNEIERAKKAKMKLSEKEAKKFTGL